MKLYDDANKLDTLILRIRTLSVLSTKKCSLLFKEGYFSPTCICYKIVNGRLKYQCLRHLILINQLHHLKYIPSRVAKGCVPRVI